MHNHKVGRVFGTQCSIVVFPFVIYGYSWYCALVGKPLHNTNPLSPWEIIWILPLNSVILHRWWPIINKM